MLAVLASANGKKRNGIGPDPFEFSVDTERHDVVRTAIDLNRLGAWVDYKTIATPDPNQASACSST